MSCTFATELMEVECIVNFQVQAALNYPGMSELVCGLTVALIHPTL
jgi:hypothetical protein